MLSRDSEDEMWTRFVFELVLYDFKKLLWQDELNPWVRCAFANVSFCTRGRECPNFLFLFNLKHSVLSMHSSTLVVMYPNNIKWFLKLFWSKCYLRSSWKSEPGGVDKTGSEGLQNFFWDILFDIDIDSFITGLEFPITIHLCLKNPILSKC